MTQEHPTALKQVPLFPLKAVLCPDGWLPLRVFELRYLDMIGRCQRNQAPFGVVLLTEGEEVREVTDGGTSNQPNFFTEKFAPVGTLAQIESIDKSQAGLWLIQCRGTQRFRIDGTQQLQHGLWTADIHLLESDSHVVVSDHLQATSDALKQLLDNLTEHQPQALDTLPMREPYRWDDCGWVANRWLELLPLPLPLKQQLLTLDNPMLRLELVADQLERMGVQN
jgi:Lon protease-like protein